MKTKQTITVAVLIALAVIFGYLLGYQLGSKSNQANLSTPGKLRQIGLAFRHGRNDVQSLIITSRDGQPSSLRRQSERR